MARITSEEFDFIEEWLFNSITGITKDYVVPPSGIEEKGWRVFYDCDVNNFGVGFIFIIEHVESKMTMKFNLDYSCAINLSPGDIKNIFKQWRLACE